MLDKFVLYSTAGIFTKAPSDHQPNFLFMDVNLKTKLPPKFVTVNLQNKVKMHRFKTKVNTEDIYNKLNAYPKADPNLNYNIIHEEIMRANDKHMPIKIM